MKKWWFIAAILLAGCGGSGSDESDPLPPVTCSVYVDWEAPTEYTGGAELTLEDIAYYEIFVSFTEDLDAQEFSLVVRVDNPNMIQWNIRDLPVGSWWFAMKVTDIHGETSTYSNVQDFVCAESP